MLASCINEKAVLLPDSTLAQCIKMSLIQESASHPTKPLGLAPQGCASSGLLVFMSCCIYAYFAYPELLDRRSCIAWTQATHSWAAQIDIHIKTRVSRTLVCNVEWRSSWSMRFHLYSRIHGLRFVQGDLHLGVVARRCQIYLSWSVYMTWRAAYLFK